ncbi:hypothetical protein [Rubripirellula reticaptiva]|uniref:hypothetical protein n=1 Tax=Rubripirellula reticaptiva TaxID=2528013 RepID=UPI0016484C36|nr:hypothetical protein [Rubripirellula reticaptiva]
MLVGNLQVVLLSRLAAMTQPRVDDVILPVLLKFGPPCRPQVLERLGPRLNTSRFDDAVKLGAKVRQSVIPTYATFRAIVSRIK